MKTLIQTWLLSIVFPTLSSSAQPGVPNHFDFSAGLSSTEAINVGLRYGFGQNSVGVSFGSGLPTRGFWQAISSVSYYRHLWGHSKHTLVLPWYIKGALHYSYSEVELTSGNFTHTRQAGIRVFAGHDFNLTSRVNFSMATGPIHIFLDEFYNNKKLKPHFLPGMDVVIFYRL